MGKPIGPHVVVIPALLLVVVAATIAADADPPFPRVPPTEPKAAPETFRSQAGFRMDLIAAEPLLTDPVAIAYDEDGRAYVAEMNDYPYTDAATHQPWKDNTTDKPIGRIRLLIDEDGDGAFDKSTLFAEGLSWPTGVACYKGGVYVAATPDVWYLKDTNGDGVADVRRRVFTGFRKYNVQAVMNNLIWGLDNRIYGAGGSNGGTIVAGDEERSPSPGTPGEGRGGGESADGARAQSKITNPKSETEDPHPNPPPEYRERGPSTPVQAGGSTRPVTLTRNDFRFDPAVEQFEPIPGGARFGNTFDDWGRRFVCNIRNPAQHVVMEGRYLVRTPQLTVPSVVHDVAESGDALPVYRISPPELWRDVRARRLAAERSTQPRSELVAAGVVTSASGVTVYRGDAYPPEFRGQFFLGEVANNLIHRQAIRPDGVTFTSSRVDEKVEIVASTDIWFRPVNFVNAPDGTLHVLDMYRECIEHPWSIPDDIRAKLDLRSGADRGRIYRLAPPGFTVPKPPRLSKASTAELVALLASRNAWHRETAQRLIVERQDNSAVAPLRELLATTKEPLGRLHALWTLEGLGATKVDDILRGMDDPSPGVRENAVQLAERHLHELTAEGSSRLLKLAEDADARVRFQAVLTLGQSRAGAPVTESLAKALRRDAAAAAADPWMVVAVLSSSKDREGDLLTSLAADATFASSAGGREAARRLAVLVGAGGRQEVIEQAIDAAARSKPLATTIATGLGEGLRRNRKTLRQAVPDANSPAGRALSDLLADASRTAADPAASIDERAAAVRLLGFDDFDRVRPILPDLLAPRHPPEVQRAAVAALAGIGQPDVGAILLSGWKSYTPALRAEAAQAMLAYRNRLPALLDALEAGTVSPFDIPASRRAALLKDADAKVRMRATKLFGGEAAGGGGRKAVIDRYADALKLPGDREAGMKVFAAACAACHRLGDQGNDVGPNLATVRQWGPEQLLTNILDPNREVAPSFVEYVVELADGEQLSGVVAEETGTSLTLKWSGGGQRVIPRDTIRKIFASRTSLMPEGVEATITVQQMADLIALLRG